MNMNATLAYAAEYGCRLPFKGFVLASNAIGLTLLLAPAVWFQASNVLSRTLSGSAGDDRFTAALMPHIIALPAEVMLVLSVIGAFLGTTAARQAQVLALEGYTFRRWSMAIMFGILCNVAGAASNIVCLMQL
jgi:hypothetical protein